ncbi:MAG TPA: hypothetical protein VIL37_12445 [Natronosporangium sp.]
MARYESPEPGDITDRLLWRDAQQMLDRHAHANADGRCEWCGWHWPCPPRRLAERAEVAASRPWRTAWTAQPAQPAQPAGPVSNWHELSAWHNDMPSAPPGPFAPTGGFD